MAETSNQIPPSGIGKLKWSDVWKGLIKSIAGLFVGVIVKIIHERELPEYSEIAPILEAAFYFLIGYLGVNAGTNNTGQLFRKDQPTVTVPAKELEKVIDIATDKVK